MLKIWVYRKTDDVLVYVMRNKNDGTWSFVNMTKGHICPCRFKTVSDALADLQKRRREGSVVDYTIVGTESR